MATRVVEREVTEQVSVKVCDRCDREIEGTADVTAEVLDRDYSGGVVYSHTVHLCQSCTLPFYTFLRGEK